MNQRSEQRGAAVFRPTLMGCVAKDIRLARAVEECYVEQLASAMAYTYRSLITEQIDRGFADRMDDVAVEKAEHFRMLGELILALGGDPVIRTQLRIGGADRCLLGAGGGGRIPERLLRDALQEEKRLVDRLQNLMGHTQDRVVRSLLSYILSDEERQIAYLQDVLHGGGERT